MAWSSSVRFAAGGVAGFLALTVVIAIAVLASAFAFGAPQTVVFNNIPFAFLICATISGSAYALMAGVAPLVRGRLLPIQWAVFIPTFALAGAIGTLLAAVVVALVGIVPVSAIIRVFEQNIRGTIPTSIIVGTVIMVFEQGKARLRAAETQLQVQRLERERAERLASQAQLASLTARVQPHFLFNTLNSIAALVREDPYRAETLIEQLSALLRSSLDTAAVVPLERELTLVRHYLDIQQARFGSRLRFTIDEDARGIRGATVPPFAIQTLVENAVKHVAGQRERGVSLRVRARAVAGDTIVEVVDDGEGFAADQLPAGHGLDTLLSRLSALYGERAALEFDRGDAMMTVRLRLPSTVDAV